MLKKRFIEIDFIKGIAIISMVIFHFFYLSTHMNVKAYDCDSGILRFLARFSHLTFITMSGLNMAISIANKKREDYQLKKIKRGVYLIALGLVISYVSKLQFGELYVKFGIMHFMGTATILSSFYTNLPKFSTILAMLIFTFNIILKTTPIKNWFYDICSTNPFLCFITGILNIKYSSLDHFPLIPYLGFFSLGIGLAYYLYNLKGKKERKYQFLGVLDNYKDNVIVKNISWMGKRTLEIYVIHFVLFWAYLSLFTPLKI